MNISSQKKKKYYCGGKGVQHFFHGLRYEYKVEYPSEGLQDYVILLVFIENE